MPYILEVDEFIFEMNESLKETIVKKAHKSLGDHASFEDYVFKQLLGYNFSFLWEDRGKNHQPFYFW